MNKKQPYFIIGLLIVFVVSTIGLVIALGIVLTTQSAPIQSSVIMQETVVVRETVIVEVTPTSTPIPSPTVTTFPQSTDRIVFLSVWENDFYTINADGTHLARITNDGEEKSCPLWNPDGKRISFFVPSTNIGYYDVYIMDVNGENRKFLFQAKLDREYGQMPQWSPDGTKLAFSAYDDTSPNSHIFIFDGINVNRVTDSTARERFPVWSPDGSKIAYISYHLQEPIFVASSLDGIESWLISALPASNFFPITWSPDGKRLAFISGEDVFTADFNEIYSIDKRTAFLEGENYAPSWSPEGNTIAYYYQQASCCGADIVFIPANRPVNSVEMTNQIWAYQESPITWSSDGKYVAIVGDTNTDNWNIYVVDINGNKVKITDSDRRDHCPVWSP